jgi:hypothetical protein
LQEKFKQTKGTNWSCWLGVILRRKTKKIYFFTFWLQFKYSFLVLHLFSAKKLGISVLYGGNIRNLDVLKSQRKYRSSTARKSLSLKHFYCSKSCVVLKYRYSCWFWVLVWTMLKLKKINVFKVVLSSYNSRSS